MKRIGSFISAGVMGIGLLGNIGCDTTRAPRTPSADRVTNYPNIVLIDRLDRDLVASQPIVKPATNDTPLSVVAPIRSISDKPLYLKYCFVFLDADGKALSDPVWYEIAFLDRTQRNLSANAISLKAVDWRLEIRR
jgi:hypothetical protein